MNESSLFKLDGKNALVVGGGLGMGKASSEILASVGARVAVADIDPARSENVASSIKQAGGYAIALSGDALDPAGATNLVNEAASQLGSLDVLVNIVGQAAYGALLDTPIETFDSEITRNLKYVFSTGTAFARLAAASPGTPRAIVCIASISGFQSAPKHASYGAAKAGLMSLTRSMAQEWGGLGIRVNCVAPGVIKTDRSQGTPEMEQVLNEQAPLHRRGDQTEIAKGVLFLASDLASYVTGHTLLVDGGVQSNYAVRLAQFSV